MDEKRYEKLFQGCTSLNFAPELPDSFGNKTVLSKNLPLCPPISPETDRQEADSYTFDGFDWQEDMRSAYGQ